MKTIIAGSRCFTELSDLDDAIFAAEFEGIDISCILCGLAKGADTLGKKWAIIKGIPIEYYPANWTKYGKIAGFKRNIEMAKNADALIALWDGKSPGTKHMIAQAKKYKLLTFIYTPN